MLLPSYLLVLLMSLPLLIASSPQHPVDLQITACSRPCGAGNFCNSGTCVPCEAAGCGIGAICNVDQAGNLMCNCPANTHGNPVAQCHPVKECNDHSHCGTDNLCDSRRRCFDPCSSVKCAVGDVCKVDKRTSRYGCLTVKDIVGNRQSPTQVGNQGVDNQVNNQVGSAQGVIQDDGTQIHQQGGDTEGVNQGGSSAQSGSGFQPVSGTHSGSSTQSGSGIHSGSITQPGSGTHSGISTQPGSGTQSGSNPQVGSGAQDNNQQGSAQGGCKISSQCRSNERCQSGSCVDPCVSVKCGEGAICQVSQRQGQCVCPENSQGNPHVQCNPKPECTLDSNCKDNKICQSGSCVDPCVLIQCGEGAVCNRSQRRGQCVCADNTPVDPGVQCNPEQGDTDTAFPDPVSEHKEGTRNPGCLNAPDPGECRGAFKRFYYNKQTDQCDCFLFGGCDEEKIKFTWLTFEECQRTCVPGNKTQGQGCKRATLEEVQIFLEEERRNRKNSKE